VISWPNDGVTIVTSQAPASVTEKSKPWSTVVRNPCQEILEIAVWEHYFPFLMSSFPRSSWRTFHWSNGSQTLTPVTSP
jgi:hypothetical protein